VWCTAVSDSSFGAAFPTFYRLVGPFRSASAPNIAKTELWDTIKRRGVIGNIFMGVIPMASLSAPDRSATRTNHQAFYAVVNLLALMLEVGWTWTAPLLGYRHVPSYKRGGDAKSR
jgi:dimethylaniline monooxygenase (N-oxide forming)